MACVPQFDTMHPSMSLGAFFNDRNFTERIGEVKILEKKPQNILTILNV